MLSAPTPDHRCYRRQPPAAPDAARQETFCLSADHSNCPVYQKMPVPDGAAETGPVVVPPPPTDSPIGRRYWSSLLTFGSIGLALCLVLVNLFGFYPSSVASTSIQRPPNQTTAGTTAPATHATPVAVAAVVTSTVTPISPPPLTEAVVQVAARERFATPTAEPGGQVLSLHPSVGNAGWWKDQDTQRNHLGDSYLYAGTYGGETFISAARFDLTLVPRGAPIRQAQLRLSGLRRDQFQPEAEGLWLMQLVPQSSLELLGTADFLAMLSAPAAMTLFPPLSEGELVLDQVNEWQLDAATLRWLEQQLLDGATSVTLRIQSSVTQGEALFAWDSGLGTETQGNGPLLLLSIGPPPPTPPPLPTRPVVVATLTPVPQDVLTVVALAKTATAVAFTTGTYTPVPYAIVTPTPFPANLETVQAVALALQLPAVVLHTPTPAGPLMATRQAEYATAVAVTTGTFTPVPTAYVTPMLVVPSPPPENVATEAARVALATAAVENNVPTPTPLPYNGVIAEYVYATLVPENEATAIADAVIATASAKVNGTPTPLRWTNIVITAVPSATELPPPSATPLPLLQSIAEFTPTPTPLGPQVVPDTLPDYLSNKIVFKTNRNGPEEIYALDPLTGELFRINEVWVYPLAQRQMGLSPTGDYQAIVQEASNGTMQIHIRSLAHNSVRQITALNGLGSGRDVLSYDPDWSPSGELIAFVSTNSGNDEIYTITVDGSILKQLTINDFEWDKHPSWSPDGHKIVFFSNRDSGRRQLWLMHADGSGQQNLSNNEYEDWDPIWIR